MIGQTDPESGLLGWVLGACGVIGTTLVGAIVFLAKYISSEVAKRAIENQRRLEEVQEAHTKELLEVKEYNKELGLKSEKCEKDREQLLVSHARLETRVSLLEAKGQDV